MAYNLRLLLLYLEEGSSGSFDSVAPRFRSSFRRRNVISSINCSKVVFMIQNGDISCPWIHLVISSISVSKESCSMERNVVYIYCTGWGTVTAPLYYSRGDSYGSPPCITTLSRKNGNLLKKTLSSTHNWRALIILI